MLILLLLFKRAWSSLNGTIIFGFIYNEKCKMSVTCIEGKPFSFKHFNSLIVDDDEG